MAKDQKSVDGIIEKLALITDATQTLFPNGKSAVIFELNYEDYKKVQSNFRQVDSGYEQFKIDLSDVEVIFILENIKRYVRFYPDTKREERKRINRK